MDRITVFACENQPIVVEGLHRIAERYPYVQLCGSAPEVELAAAAAEREKAGILLLGQPPGARSALSLLSRAQQAEVRSALVLLVSDISDMDCFRALQMGAKGVVSRLQTIENFVECLRTVASGVVWLDAAMRAPSSRAVSRIRITPREREIIELVSKGLKNREIAEVMSITPGTVKVHLMHIFEKTGVRDRFQLALRGRQFTADKEELTANRTNETLGPANS